MLLVKLLSRKSLWHITPRDTTSQRFRCFESAICLHIIHIGSHNTMECCKSEYWKSVKIYSCEAVLPVWQLPVLYRYLVFAFLQ